jgi:hypothetical protein
VCNLRSIENHLKIPKPAEATKQLLIQNVVFFSSNVYISDYGTELFRHDLYYCNKNNIVINYDLRLGTYVVVED